MRTINSDQLKVLKEISEFYESPIEALVILLEAIKRDNYQLLGGSSKIDPSFVESERKKHDLRKTSGADHSLDILKSNLNRSC